MKPIHPPIVQSTIYEFDHNEEMRETMLSGQPYFYIRSGNPTVDAVAEQLRAIEGGEAALLFSSGMAAISCSLFALLQSGDHIVCHQEIFSQTRTLLDVLLRKFHVDVRYEDFHDLQSVDSALSGKTKVLYVETPSNPALDIINLQAVAGLARKNDILLIVDSTLATPVLQNPLKHGASLVLHSATKYLSGHADVLCGAIVGGAKIISTIHAVQKLTGGVLDPHVAYLLDRGLSTLSLRMKQICENALVVAEFLSGHPHVQWVRYPFLDNHTDSAIAHAQMSGGGGVISFELKGGIAAARKFVNALGVIRIATSLGGTKSTIEIPYELKKIRDDQDPTMGLIRLSVGLENADWLVKDLENALKTVDRA
jgi:cystathionine beta-lyase/cystathionine gamma-synthase